MVLYKGQIAVHSRYRLSVFLSIYIPLVLFLWRTLTSTCVTQDIPDITSFWL